MSNKFPFPPVCRHEIKKQFNRLKEEIKTLECLKNGEDMFRSGLIGSNITRSIFARVRLRTPVGPHDCAVIEFKNNPERFLRQHEKWTAQRKRTLLSTICFMVRSPCHFNILMACHMYIHFKASFVFDPFAGWGDRFTAAVACNIKYRGIDLNKKLTPCYEKLCRILNCKMSVTCGVNSNTVPIPKGCDLILTSPPYFDDQKKLYEKYNGTTNNYEIFMKNTLIPLIENGIKKKIKTVIVIPPNMYQDIGIPCKKKFKFKVPRGRPEKKSGWKTNNVYLF